MRSPGTWGYRAADESTSSRPGSITERSAKRWLPDAVEFVREVPRTTAGKFLKRALHEQFRHYLVAVNPDS